MYLYVVGIVFLLMWQLNTLLLQRILLISSIFGLGDTAILMELHTLICLIFCLARQCCSYGHQSWTVTWRNRRGDQLLGWMDSLFLLQESKRDRVSTSYKWLVLIIDCHLLLIKQSVASVCPSDCFHHIFWTDWPLSLSFLSVWSWS